ncbi:monocarboxylate transporter 4-like [Liolophura sinensis]|uniref:monocarboxylate transporter 4-like n=1 Tax=Liolophura sinensis TaxID=3198878 RepID=UPI0031585011
MACGIGVTGYSFGIVVVPLMLQALEETYGWRGAYLVMGGLVLNLCVCGLIMKPSVLEKSRGMTTQFLGLGADDPKILGFFNMASRVLVGLGTNDAGRGTSLDKTCVLFGSLSLQSIAILCFPWYSSTTAGRLSFAAIIGFYYGVQPSVTTPLTVDSVGLQWISPAVGMIMFGKGLGMVVGPPLATSLYNFTRDYNDTFLFGGVVNCAAAFYAW